MTRKKKSSGVNYGIQADSVTAGAMAVGERATATQNFTSGIDNAMLASAIADLKAALEASGLPPDTRAVLNEDIAAITAEGEKPEPDVARMESTLENLVNKIKLVGQLTKGAADLIEPVKKIATAVGLGAALAGFL